MGASAGDINNDGLVDFLAADMSFRTHYKEKLFMGDMSTKFHNASFFSNNQQMRNALFINTGTDHFQEAAYLAGLASTDWTWSAKLADLDNDGRLDAFFTNGSPVNLSTPPSSAPPSSAAATFDTTLLRKTYKTLPPVLEQNLAYQNQGNLRFTDQSQAWGLDHLGMSFAAVHADLDRDGDLDLIVANLDHPPLLYRNDSQQQNPQHGGVLIQLQGTQSNHFGIGAELTLKTDQGQQLRQVYPVAGFQSCQEPITHFGLGQATKILELKVRWPSGVQQTFKNLKSNQFYLVQEPTKKKTPPPEPPSTTPLYQPLTQTILAEHHEQPYNDFSRQPLLPNKLSQLGPPMAWADVDADGDVDLFLGEGTDWMGMLYLNQGGLNQDGLQFTPHPQPALARDAKYEDADALFFDANHDGHLDLYVASGSVEAEPGDEKFRDRLYFGDGHANFERAPDSWLPDLRVSTGTVAANDFDQDGDPDLFIGARSIPGQYPLAPSHALLRNEGDHFADVLTTVAPDLANAGMITDALWADVNGDNRDDLLVATDWGPVRLYLNQNEKLLEATIAAGLSQSTGWWQSLAVADVDADGDLDIIAGNFGLNTKYQPSPTKPVLAYYGDYANSGRRNFIEATYEGNTLFPLRGKSCSSAAMPHLTKKFKTYDAFAQATLEQIYTPACLQQAKRFEVSTLASSCFLNDGTGKFTRLPLPPEAQLAPIFAIAVTQANNDRIPDLLLAQNFFSPQKETGPMNGGLSLLALGKGDGTFQPLRPDHSGITIPEDAKSAAAIDLNNDGHQELCIATNNGPLKLFCPSQTTLPLARLPHPSEQTAWARKNLALAQQFVDSQQLKQSLPYLRRVLKVAPHHLDALLHLASVRRDQQRFSEAQTLLNRVRNQDAADKFQLLIGEGRLDHDLKQYDRAAATLKKALIAQPKNKEAHLHLGNTRLEQGRLEEARQHFQQAERYERLTEVGERTKIAQLLSTQADEYQQQGQEAKAIQHYKKSLRINAQHAPTLKALISLLTSETNNQLRDPWLAKHLTRRVEALTKRTPPEKNQRRDVTGGK